jgi:mannose-1-phosphate guanylyltransferase
MPSLQSGASTQDIGHHWALVLAAGEGTRLQSLSRTAAGVVVPKQYCSLGGASLLHEALQRAATVVPAQRICTVVAEQHRKWWQDLTAIPPHNIVVQPENRGTATGILLPLLQICHRDPAASVLVLPSDHYVRDEAALTAAAQRAMAQAERQDRIVLLGLSPEQPDAELGYIVPAPGDANSARAVRQFVEKPSVTTAKRLIASGGLWNSFIFAARGQTLLRAFERSYPQLVAQLGSVAISGGAPLAECYRHLPMLDFSRDIVTQSLQDLSVIDVPHCGWSDLGTPSRVAEAVDRGLRYSDMPRYAAGVVNLAARHWQTQAIRL